MFLRPLFSPRAVVLHGRLFRRAMLAACATLMLSACEQLPYDKSTAPARIAADIGIPVASIRNHGTCDYGRVPAGLADTYFYPCIYIDTADWSALLDFDPQAAKYREVLRIDYRERAEVALQSFALGEQVQIKGKASYLLINVTALSGLSGRAILEQMQAAGMPAGSSIGYIRPRAHNAQPTPVVIPIYIPAS